MTAYDKIINECELKAIRILIEVEPSGKIYVWCDKINKRPILRMFRENGIRQNPNWRICDSGTKFEKQYSVKHLAEDKGIVYRRF